MTEYEKIYRSAKRPVDLWTNYLYYNFSMRFIWLVRNSRITPNQLTISSFIVASIGCFGFAIGTRSAVVFGLILVQISYVLDCADGQMARYKQQFSAFGGWLDQMSDRIKEFLIYFSLAYGFTRYHLDVSIWAFALTALFGLYLLEYYGQIMNTYRPKLAQAYAEKHQATQHAVEADSNVVDSINVIPASSRFVMLRLVRRFIPFHGFHIGEQYAALLIFISLNAVYSFFVFVACIAILMDVYRPIVDFMKLRRGVE